MRSSITLRSSLVAVALLAQGILIPGCHAHAFSPPARALPLESSAALGEGRTGLAVETGMDAEMLGPTLLTAAGRARHGLGDGVEVGVEGTVLRVMDRGPARESPNIYGLRAGGKYAPVPHFALGFGLGGGASAAGGFVSPDVEVIGAFENRHLVPFGAARAFVSVPVAPESVDLSSFDDADDPNLQLPRTTAGLTLTWGLRLPIGDPEDDGYGASITAGVGETYLNDGEDWALLSGGQVGGEIVF